MVALNAGGDIKLAGCGLMLSWAVMAIARKTYEPSGDGYGIWRQPDGLLVAVADGSGSGQKAAETTDLCLKTLEASTGHLDADFQRCHQALKRGRGAALALIRINDETGMMTWAAVGDVDGTLFAHTAGRRTPAGGLTRIGGTLGLTFNGAAPQSQLLRPGSLIVLTTDGVRREFAQDIAPDLTAAAAAEQILHAFRRPDDDSLVLAIELRALQ
ncbi:SpoIIE family protein phosphatase [Pararhodobacter zhoushanensis]|uniref:SpoIIE family protein phosphatase n=1 Tax=Pararhodobacter zhoushanensis TaxID=2479545 RepID=UPI000F8CCF70|nr:SpoIIE family protein phosphatase [Pararhodobacter zhoushanensis]